MNPLYFLWIRRRTHLSEMLDVDPASPMAIFRFLDLTLKAAERAVFGIGHVRIRHTDRVVIWRKHQADDDKQEHGQHNEDDSYFP